MAEGLASSAVPGKGASHSASMGAGRGPGCLSDLARGHRRATVEDEQCLALDVEVATPTIAVGGELKNTVCTAMGGEARLSATHGDLLEPEALRGFLRAVKRAVTLPHNEGAVVAHDLHPAYQSTLHARRLSKRLVGVQHHHAHGVSCAVDARLPLPVLAVVCDGTGYGTDGAVWGGELLLCRADGFERLGHLEYFPLPGGDLSARYPARPALSVTREAFGVDWMEWASRLFPRRGSPRGVASDIGLIARQIETGVNAPPSSSLGRLFDAVSYLCALCDENDREGRAAAALQSAAQDALGAGGTAWDPFPYTIHAARRGALRLDWRPLIRGVVVDACRGAPATAIAARFHSTAARMFAEAVEMVADRTGVRSVVLSGGCFLNTILREHLGRLLRAAGLTVGTHARVSCGDAGLSLGQAVIGAAVANAGTRAPPWRIGAAIR